MAREGRPWDPRSPWPGSGGPRVGSPHPPALPCIRGARMDSMAWATGAGPGTSRASAALSLQGLSAPARTWATG